MDAWTHDATRRDMTCLDVALERIGATVVSSSLSRSRSLIEYHRSIMHDFGGKLPAQLDVGWSSQLTTWSFRYPLHKKKKTPCTAVAPGSTLHLVSSPLEHCRSFAAGGGRFWPLPFTSSGFPTQGKRHARHGDRSCARHPRGHPLRRWPMEHAIRSAVS